MNEEDIRDLQKSIGMSKEYCDGIWDEENMNIYVSAFNKGREDTYKLLNDYFIHPLGNKKKAIQRVARVSSSNLPYHQPRGMLSGIIYLKKKIPV